MNKFLKNIILHKRITKYVFVLVFLVTPYASQAYFSFSTPQVFNITERSAEVEVYADGNIKSTDLWFEYGKCKYFDQRESVSNRVDRYGGYGDRISGLDSGTKYFVRMVGIDNMNNIIYGNHIVFETKGIKKNMETCDFSKVNQKVIQSNKPIVVTVGLGVDTEKEKAQLSGIIFSAREDVTVWFEWGTSKGDLKNKTKEQFFSKTNQAINVYESISRLSPDTEYFYRAVAKNKNGGNVGITTSFVTKDKNFGNVSGKREIKNTNLDNSDTKDTNSFFSFFSNNTKENTEEHKAVGEGEDEKDNYFKNNTEQKETIISVVNDNIKNNKGVFGLGNLLNKDFFSVTEDGEIDKSIGVAYFGKSSMANVAGGAESFLEFLPNSFAEWSLLIIVLYLSIAKIMAVSESNGRKKEYEKEREVEGQEIIKVVPLVAPSIEKESQIIKTVQ